jgi:chromosome segregation ATPase
MQDVCREVERLEQDLAARKKRQVEVKGEVKDLERKYRAAAAGQVAGHQIRPLDGPRQIRDQIETLGVEADGLAEIVEKLEGELKEKRPLAEVERKQRRETRDAENYHAAEVKGRAILAEVERACAGLATALKVLDDFDPGFVRTAIKTGVEAAALGAVETALGATRVEALARSWVRSAAGGRALINVVAG